MNSLLKTCKIKGFFVVFLALFMSGCAKRVVYQKVLVPTKCNISLPLRPSKELDTLEYLKALLVYTEVLENDLKFCNSNE
ncbi:hypothetical protein [Helicobacter cetorum]|uniref:Lipoprotein n=1 Tax=Helicobacter cetorum (strain ATCC BAA-429 / MIT 00-7128) TaxID=182217 RepID=I0ELP4_HELC0|nr:hypothetical protein [Helicobacter cetorum]AFI03863.1 hypothetical protein HCW_02910 [Helicobacter cetorum MIT 00-7128]